MSTRRTPIKHRTEKHQLMRPVQGNLCPICNGLLPARMGKLERLTNLDHVWPLRYKRGNVGNLLVVHTACNVARGNADPTGCQLIMLSAVNAVLGNKPEISRRAWRRAWARRKAAS